MRISFSFASVALVALLALTTTGCKSGPSLAWWKKDKAEQDKFAGPPSRSFTPSTRGESGVANNTQNRNPGPNFDSYSSPQNYPSTNQPDPRFANSAYGGFSANGGGTQGQFSSHQNMQGNNGNRAAPCHACATGYCAAHNTNLSGPGTTESSIYDQEPRAADSRSQWGGSDSRTRWDGGESSSWNGGADSSWDHGTSQPSWDQGGSNPASKSWNNDQRQSNQGDSQPMPSYDSSYDAQDAAGGTSSYDAQNPAGRGYADAAADAYSQPLPDNYQPKSSPSSSGLPAELTRKDPNDWQGPGSVGRSQTTGYAKADADDSSEYPASYDSGFSGGDFQGGGGFSGPNYERTANPDVDPYHSYQR